MKIKTKSLHDFKKEIWANVKNGLKDPYKDEVLKQKLKFLGLCFDEDFISEVIVSVVLEIIEMECQKLKQEKE